MNNVLPETIGNSVRDTVNLSDQISAPIRRGIMMTEEEVQQMTAAVEAGREAGRLAGEAAGRNAIYNAVANKATAAGVGLGWLANTYAGGWTWDNVFSKESKEAPQNTYNYLKSTMNNSKRRLKETTLNTGREIDKYDKKRLNFRMNL